MDAAGPGCLLLGEVKQLFVGGRLLEQKNLSHLVLLVRKFSHKVVCSILLHSGCTCAETSVLVLWASGLLLTESDLSCPGIILSPGRFLGAWDPCAPHHPGLPATVLSGGQKPFSPCCIALGTAIITEEYAAMWTDGRYFLQAAKQMDNNWTLMKMGG